MAESDTVASVSNPVASLSMSSSVNKFDSVVLDISESKTSELSELSMAEVTDLSSSSSSALPSSSQYSSPSSSSMTVVLVLSTGMVSSSTQGSVLQVSDPNSIEASSH